MGGMGGGGLGASAVAAVAAAAAASSAAPASAPASHLSPAAMRLARQQGEQQQKGQHQAQLLQKQHAHNQQRRQAQEEARTPAKSRAVQQLSRQQSSSGSSSTPSTPGRGRSGDAPEGAHIVMLNLQYDPPVSGCELKPYVLVCDAEGKRHATENDDRVTFEWMRGQRRRCSVLDCGRTAQLQCLPFLDRLREEPLSFVCSAACMRKAWPAYREMVARGDTKPRPPLLWAWQARLDAMTSEAEAQAGRVGVEGGPPAEESAACRAQRFPPPAGNTWETVGTSRCYRPTSDDRGCALRLRVSALGADGNPVAGPPKEIVTSAVIGAPEPPPKRTMSFLDPVPGAAESPFTVMCYNILAETYATRQLYPYAPVWALSWEYRRVAILQHLIVQDTDLLFLQEVQQNHYEDFFCPEMASAGYEGIYKHKTRSSSGADARAIDGCAIFYKRNRFALVERYEISFDALARKQTPNNRALRRMCKGNVAIAAVLEYLGPPAIVPGRRPVKRQVCVCNAHLYWDPEFADVKLWQTWKLCQELERLVVNRNLPLVLAGDLNSTPDSSVYALLSRKSVRRDHPDFRLDECRILPQHGIQHVLPLVSAYQQAGAEPQYTNFTGHFVGTLDYVWVSHGGLAVCAVLDVDDRDTVSAHTALPAPQYPSDHISLVTQIDWVD